MTVARCELHVSPTVGCQTCLVPREEGPEDGHTFRITIESRGSYGVVGVSGHTDAEEFAGGARTVEVRAWDLPAALRKAAALPLATWFAEDD